MKVSDLQRVLAEIDPDLPIVLPDSEFGKLQEVGAVRVAEILDFPINIDNPTFTQVAILAEEDG